MTACQRHRFVRLQESNAFKTPRADDTYLQTQDRRAELAGLSPQEYEVATRNAANQYIADNGLHASSADSGEAQTASFLKQLWNLDSVPALPTTAAAAPSRVVATVYEIGGPLTGVLSNSVAKQLPLIPHVG